MLGNGYAAVVEQGQLYWFTMGVTFCAASMAGGLKKDRRPTGAKTG